MDTRKMLEYQADQIEAVLAQHGAPGRVTGGTVTPRCIRFRVQPAMGARIGAIKNLAEELAVALDAPSVRVTRQGAAVQIEIVRPDPQPISVIQMMMSGNLPAMTAVLGLCDDGAPLLARLTSAEANTILAVGEADGLLRAIALSLLIEHPDPTDLILAVVGDLGDDLAAVPQAIGAGEPIEEMPERLAAVMDRRREYPNRPASPAVVVLIAPDAFEQIAASPDLARLLREGEDAGIYVVAGARRDHPGLRFALHLREVDRATDSWQVVEGGYRFTPAEVGEAEQGVLVAMRAKSLAETLRLPAGLESAPALTGR